MHNVPTHVREVSGVVRGTYIHNDTGYEQHMMILIESCAARRELTLMMMIQSSPTTLINRNTRRSMMATQS